LKSIEQKYIELFVSVVIIWDIIWIILSGCHHLDCPMIDAQSHNHPKPTGILASILEIHSGQHPTDPE